MPALASSRDAEPVDLGRRWDAALGAERARYGTFGLHKAMSATDVQEHDAIGDRLYGVWSMFSDRIVATPATPPPASR